MLLAVVLVLGVLATSTVGHAAVLPVVSRSVGGFTTAHPCAGTATATPTTGTARTFTQISVALPSAACTGLLVMLTVVNGSTLVVQGMATASGANALITVPSYVAGTGYTVRATIGGWNLPTTWSYMPPAQPFTTGNGETVIESIVWSGRCADIAVTTSTTRQSPWRVNVNIAAAPFDGATTGYSVAGNTVGFDPASGIPSNGVLGIVGTVNGWDTLSANQRRSFTVCF
jgi:hypothetical protein